MFIIFLLLFTVRCSEDQFLTVSSAVNASAEIDAQVDNTGTVTDCLSCTYVVPNNQGLVDGAALGLKPGSIIGLRGNYGSLTFRNIVGTADNPIIIKNCGGTAYIDGTGRPNAIKTERSKYFRITGGDVDNVYGIKVFSGHMGVSLGSFTTDVEVDHVEITKSGFAGIIAKTDPTCDEATWRGNFLMENVKLHHNYIAETGGEGIYAGNSFYGGMNTDCGVKLPHEIHGITIYKNVLKNTGWEAIQLGCATRDASIHSNTIENYGVENVSAQNNGIQIGAGTGGVVYNNLIRKGAGNGIIVMGLGDNVIYNNIIDQAGGYGIFCDERASTGQGFVFLNNTIIEPKSDGIRIYAEQLPMNVIVNNVIAKPGSGTYVHKMNGVKVDMTNNYFTPSTDSLQFTDSQRNTYKLKTTSPVIDRGRNVTSFYPIDRDFYSGSRPVGAAFDIGAVETAHQNQLPIADAGRDLVITLPTNFVKLTGKGFDPDGIIASYEWIQYGGQQASISDRHTPIASVSDLKEGTYYFRLSVTDDKGARDDDNMLVRVNPLPSDLVSAEPSAYAGKDQSIIWPLNSVVLAGKGEYPGGTIVKYEWTQYGGPRAQISNSLTPTASVTFPEPGKYYFRLTVTANNGSQAFDNVLVKVLDPVANY